VCVSARELVCSRSVRPPTPCSEEVFPRSAANVVQAKTIHLTAPERTPTEVDGELLGHLPARFSAMPSRLRVLVP
jgi:hypothetical protein